MTIYEYIKRYGNKTFKEKKFNEIDNLIFSLIVYLNFNEILNEETNTIEKVGKKIIEKYTYREISEYGIPQRDAYKCMKLLINANRYKNIEISNYIYIGTNEEQFSALTFKINKRLIYVSFEGTDNLISGWKEDFQLAYMYPTISQTHAINYLKNSIKLFGPKIIVGGHSKGGNLALISAMEQNRLKKLKIKQIYNNDGPGLRLKQFTSKQYRQIKNKHIHIIPYNSIVGILLRNDKYKVVASTKKTVLSHAIATWMIYDDQLLETELTKKSKELEKSIIEWLNSHSDDERQLMIENVFDIFKRCNITDTRDLKKIRSIIRILKEVRNIDEETKNITTSFINYNFF